MKCKHYELNPFKPDDKSCRHIWKCGPICNDGEKSEDTQDCFTAMENEITKSIYGNFAPKEYKKIDRLLIHNPNSWACILLREGKADLFIKEK